jgi:hypothetical protein
MEGRGGFTLLIHAALTPRSSSSPGHDYGDASTQGGGAEERRAQLAQEQGSRSVEPKQGFSSSEAGPMARIESNRGGTTASATRTYFNARFAPRRTHREAGRPVRNQFSIPRRHTPTR